MKSRSEKARVLYGIGLNSVSNGGQELTELARHIAVMVFGNSEYEGGLWKERTWPDQTITLERFDDYLIKPAREGLGIPSLLWLNQLLDAHERKEEKEAAFRAVRQEIPDFDARVAKELAKRRVREPEAAKKQGAHEGNQNASKDKNKDSASTFVSSDNQPKQKRDSSYWIARLKRDAETDPKAQALLDTLEAGDISARRAAIEMGWVKPADPVKIIEKQREKLAPDDQVRAWQEWGRAIPDEALTRYDAAQEAFLNLTEIEQTCFLRWANGHMNSAKAA